MAGSGEVVGMMGMGKLGLPVALAIESQGHKVVGFDIRDEPYDYIENRYIPYKEEGVEPLLENTKIEMVRDLGALVCKSDIIFLPVQTPHLPQYEGDKTLPSTRADFDYHHLEGAVAAVAVEAEEQEKPTTLAVISTCLPGTFKERIRPLLNQYVDYVYTPQFIAMGGVVQDYLNPEFNLIGVDKDETADKLEEFYKTINDAPALRTDITTAEGIKVSYNTFITMKTVLANTWGELSHKLGMNVDDIYRAWSMSDKRLLSPRYLKSGVGDGGGCHPRDNIALSHLAEKVKLSHNLFEDLMKSREQHMEWLAEMAYTKAWENSLYITILGRSFKPETNIETGSPSILMSNILREHGIPHDHVEDVEELDKRLYVIGTAHERYKSYKFPKGSIILDPFGIIDDQVEVDVVRIGRK